MVSKYTKEWKTYKNDYDKEFYDIKTSDGQEYYGCYPNAGFFHPLSNKNKRLNQIRSEEVETIRLTHHHPLDED